MGNLATLLTVALVCAAFGFVAGSMLTSIWIDRNAKPSRAKRKSSEKAGKEFAKIVLDPNGEPTSLEIEGEIYTSNHRPDAVVVEKLKATSDLLNHWYGKAEKGIEKKEIPAKEEKSIKTKSTVKEADDKPENHDMLFEINNLIQKKLKSSSIVDRKIRLARVGATGVAFWVDENKYETLDAIPEIQVRDMIKGAVSDWESHVR